MSQWQLLIYLILLYEVLKLLHFNRLYILHLYFLQQIFPIYIKFRECIVIPSHKEYMNKKFLNIFQSWPSASVQCQSKFIFIIASINYNAMLLLSLVKIGQMYI